MFVKIIKKRDENPDLEIVIDYDKTAINVLNYMYTLATHSEWFLQLS